jgi:hypothetical protein
MDAMFDHAEMFNQSLNDWNVSKVLRYVVEVQVSKTVLCLMIG